MQWIKEDCKDIKTYIILAIVSVILFSPVWGGFILGVIFDWTWGYALAGATFALLVGPIPFWVISIAVTLAIKRILDKKKMSKTVKRCKTRTSSASEKCHKDCCGCEKRTPSSQNETETPREDEI